MPSLWMRPWDSFNSIWVFYVCKFCLSATQPLRIFWFTSISMSAKVSNSLSTPKSIFWPVLHQLATQVYTLTYPTLEEDGSFWGCVFLHSCSLHTHWALWGIWSWLGWDLVDSKSSEEVARLSNGLNNSFEKDLILFSVVALSLYNITCLL